MVQAKTVKATIDGIPVDVPAGTTILSAARSLQVKIPVLCKHPDLPPTASCGLCIVKVKGSAKFPRACCTALENGMDITTRDPELVEVRKTTIEMILSRHPNECFTCGRNGCCELQTLAADFGIRSVPLADVVPDLPKDDSTKAIVLEPRKCVSCGRCVVVCQEEQNIWALSFLERGFDTRIAPAGEIALAESPCVRCGQCAAHCPTGAIHEYSEVEKVWSKLKDPSLHCVVQIAPAVRVAIGEMFGLPPGTNMTGELYNALRRLGFKGVFDTNFGADLTIMEEGAELVDRIKKADGALPLITSCCPSWIDYMEKTYGDMIPHFSSAKSPHEMVGVLAKTYYAERTLLDPAKVYSVSIMPCTAKKYEITRADEMFASGYQDVDCVLTTRELGRMLKQAGIDFTKLAKEEPDQLLGDYSGAGTIFGVTGGVMEAALRTAYRLVTRTELDDDALEFEDVRGMEGVRESRVEMSGKTLKLAVAHGLGNVDKVLNKVRQAKEKGEETPYHLIEVMACSGGCIGGGGQPYGVTDGLRAARAAGLYEDDRCRQARRSHQNHFIQRLYEDFLGAPLSHKSHELLHTTYKARPLYQR
jgi:NADH-quinone oxidoreductase subunit G